MPIWKKQLTDLSSGRVVVYISMGEHTLTFPSLSLLTLQFLYDLQISPNQPNILGCYVTLGWKCLPSTKTLTYWAHLLITKRAEKL
jgi:hypothetical protein